MSRRLSWGRALSWLFLLLFSSCASRSLPGTGGSGFLVAPDSPLEAHALALARRAEAQRMRSELGAVVGAAPSAPGERWVFRYWAQDGALTLLSFQRTRTGQGPASSLEPAAFLPRFADTLPSLVGSRSAEVLVTLTRQSSGWAADLETSARSEAPLPARALPSAHTGLAASHYPLALAAAQAMARWMAAPASALVRWQAEVSLEDSHVVSWEPTEQDASGPSLQGSFPETPVSLLLSTLGAFTHGLGARSFSLVVERQGAPSRPSWRVVEARMLLPPAPPPEVQDFAREYRAMHEYILHQWREECIRPTSTVGRRVASGVTGGPTSCQPA